MFVYFMAGEHGQAKVVHIHQPPWAGVLGAAGPILRNLRIPAQDQAPQALEAPAWLFPLTEMCPQEFLYVSVIREGLDFSTYGSRDS